MYDHNCPSRAVEGPGPMTPQQPVAEAQRSTSPPGDTVLTPGSMEVNDGEDGQSRHVTAIFVNTDEGVEALRRLEARIEKARREERIIPPSERVPRRKVSEVEREDDSPE